MQKIKCLECGKFFIKPLAHCWQKHGISAREYKELHGLDVKKGIIPEEHKEKLRMNLIANGTIENLKVGKKYRFKKGSKTAGKYKRSEQSIKRLTEQIKGKGGAPKPVKKIKIYCATCGRGKKIYPRYYKENNNYCGVRCRNISNNIKKSQIINQSKTKL